MAQKLNTFVEWHSTSHVMVKKLKIYSITTKHTVVTNARHIKVKYAHKCDECQAFQNTNYSYLSHKFYEHIYYVIIF